MYYVHRLFVSNRRHLLYYIGVYPFPEIPVCYLAICSFAATVSAFIMKARHDLFAALDVIYDSY
ncbi:hypothetical protein M433DRAFT_9908 [Acidomyces richmondensis BFW]|nr:hypothetical protein M433DRAFT_9908 [Acidomyces richmondensis BFW]